jgi:hypothetical protein
MSPNDSPLLIWQRSTKPELFQNLVANMLGVSSRAFEVKRARKRIPYLLPNLIQLHTFVIIVVSPLTMEYIRNVESIVLVWVH